MVVLEAGVSSLVQRLNEIERHTLVIGAINTVFEESRCSYADSEAGQFNLK